MSDSWPTSGVDLHLELDPAMGRRAGLEQALRAAIQTGRLAPQARLPATRKLAADVGVSRGTVRAAYDQLIAEGYLTARQGSGTAVAGLPPRHTDRPAGLHDRALPRPRHDLRPGLPDASAFPTAAWLRSTRRALGSAPADAYTYDDPRGRIELRTALAEYLGRTRGVLAQPDLIMITSGYVQALALLSRVLSESSMATIATEDPGVSFHREVIRRNGSAVVPLPVDERGARTDLLAAPGFPPVDAVEVTPAHQYPTGHTLDPARRQALVDWARSSGALIIENDYDGEFRYGRQPVGAIQGMAPDHIAYVGTVSKTLGPALRLGWIVMPHRLLEPLVEAKRHSDRHTETIGQLALADFIACHGYDRHVRSCRLRYQRRRDLLLTRLRDRKGLLPPTFSVHGIAAGLHVLISLPSEGPTEQDVLHTAAANEVGVGHLGDRWHAPGDRPQGIIVGYGTPSEHAYPAAVDALAHVLRTTITQS
ncbi:PLP-dependent aminotransferase family protein [Microbispora sp. NBC_01189]|uniref:MocR-like pyridoxine biosynthesis transcription factor PdxR n=1 Tax=Microbispora sp. NBC_01189 TaxID=2903583 RepID=UPI002E131087|nr:PLP-dependent aminotransferase family protein [Microbispora sp. NBC_01189]